MPTPESNSGDGGISPDNYVAPPPPPPGASSGSCPALDFHFGKKGKGKGKGRDSQTLALTDLNSQCCLDSSPPYGLTAFYWHRQASKTSSLAVVVGVAGSVMMVAAIGLFAWRKHSMRSVDYENIVDGAETAGYAVPFPSA